MTQPSAELQIEDDHLIVRGGDELRDRRSRRFFRSVLGAEATGDGWLIRRRGTRLSELVLRVNAFLEKAGFDVDRGDVADREVELAMERARSYGRSLEAAKAWKEGLSPVDAEAVRQGLDEWGWRPERTLREHQLRDATHALAATNQANFSVPGSGKTVTALAVLASHVIAGTVDVAIVVGPLAAFEPWQTEAEAAMGEKLRPQRVRGAASQRRRRYAAAVNGDVMLMSYATAAADKPALIALADRVNLMLIVDESHRIKRFRGGVWAPALVELARHARVRMILSGTPMPNRPLDLYTQLSVLWPDGELTGTRTEFASNADRRFPRILEKVGPFTTRTAKDELGLQPLTVIQYDVPLEGTQAEVYRLIEGRFRQRIADAHTWRDKIDTLRRGRPIRLLQAATNPSLLNRADKEHDIARVKAGSPTLMDRLARFSQTDDPAKSLRALALVEGVVGTGKKVVCWSNFVGNLDAFRRLVDQRLGVPTFQIDGRVPAADDPAADSPGVRIREDETREQILHEFRTIAGPAVLVTNPASSSESISLHHACQDAIYLDRTYDAALFLQSVDRIHRLGLPPDTPVTIHVLKATVDGQPTIDHLVEQSLNAKEARMRRLLEGAELHPLNLGPTDTEGDDQDLEALIRYLVGEEEAGGHP